MQQTVQTIQMKLNDPWYSLVAKGTKVYEGRRSSDKVLALQPGDVIVFSHYIDTSLPEIRVRVIEILRFPTFEDALVALPMNEVLEDGLSIAEGVEIYKKYVSLGTQVAEGVVMIKIELL